jgi:periplasmic protein TonB
MQSELRPQGLLSSAAQRATPPFAGGPLAWVVLAHLAVAAALMATQAPPVLPATNALMVEMVAAIPAAIAHVSAPPKSNTPSPKPLPVAPHSRPQAAVAAPVLASEGQTPSTAPEVPTHIPSSIAPSPQTAATVASPAAAAATSTTHPRFDADYLDNPPPSYPLLSRRLREEGKVVLHVFVEPSGLASKVELHTSSSFERLDKSAQTAVGRWKFTPARQGATAIGAWVLVPLVFSLKG